MNTLTRYGSALAIAAIPISLVWGLSPGLAILFRFLVMGAALLVALKAFGARQALWGIAFLAVATAFNPAVPVLLSRGYLMFVGLLTEGLLLLSLRYISKAPRLTALSIISLARRGESL